MEATRPCVSPGDRVPFLPAPAPLFSLWSLTCNLNTTLLLREWGVRGGRVTPLGMRAGETYSCASREQTTICGFLLFLIYLFLLALLL